MLLHLTHLSTGLPGFFRPFCSPALPGSPQLSSPLLCPVIAVRCSFCSLQFPPLLFSPRPCFSVPVPAFQPRSLPLVCPCHASALLLPLLLSPRPTLVFVPRLSPLLSPRSPYPCLYPCLYPASSPAPFPASALAPAPRAPLPLLLPPVFPSCPFFSVRRENYCISEFLVVHLRKI